MITIPAESEIDAMDAASTLALAESLLIVARTLNNGEMLITTAGQDVDAIKRMVLTARRCLDPGPPDPDAPDADPDIGQDQVTFDEALELYEALVFAGGTLDPVSDETDDELDYVIAIANFFSANLPA